MEKIVVLFPSKDSECTYVRDDFAAEFDACAESDLFIPEVYNEDDFSNGAPLRVSNLAPSKTTYCIRRGRGFREDASRLKHAMKRLGYYDALSSTSGCHWRSQLRRQSDKPDIRDYMPQTIQPYHRYRRRTSGEYGWFPDLCVFKNYLPAVAKNHNSVYRDDNGNVKVFEDLPSWKDVELVIVAMSDRPLDSFNGTMWSAPMYFERYVDIAHVDGTPVEWRAFYFDSQIIDLAPKPKLMPNAFPKPPADLLGIASGPLCFWSVDFAMDASGRWWILRSVPGEEAVISPGGSPSQFYRSLAQAIECGLHTPSWCWCLVADVVANHPIGEGHVMVAGTRHFAPGTKVYFADAYWRSGSERCTVIGVPKYSDYPVGVVMRTDYLTNFRLEKVTDQAIVKALLTNRLREPFERNRRTFLLGSWGTSEEDRGEIEKLAIMFNERPSAIPPSGLTAE